MVSFNITFFLSAFHIISQEKEVNSKLERWGVKINDGKCSVDITAQKRSDSVLYFRLFDVLPVNAVLCVILRGQGSCWRE